jgi:hypothetical protein
MWLSLTGVDPDIEDNKENPGAFREIKKNWCFLHFYIVNMSI